MTPAFAVLAIGCWAAAVAQDEGTPPAAQEEPAAAVARELTDEQLGLVLWDRFDRVEKRRSTLPTTPGRPSGFSGLISGPAELAATPSGQGLSLAGKGRVVYRGPSMIDLGEGTLELRLALGFTPGELGSNVDLCSLVISAGGRHLTARLYLLPRTANLIFGVYDADNRAWILTIRKTVHWKKGEFHAIKLCWKDKTSMFIDGSIVAARQSDGLLTDAISGREPDWQQSALYLGPQKSALRSDFTVESLKIYNRELKFSLD